MFVLAYTAYQAYLIHSTVCSEQGEFHVEYDPKQKENIIETHFQTKYISTQQKELNSHQLVVVVILHVVDFII
jgi:hypothetical protein